MTKSVLRRIFSLTCLLCTLLPAHAGSSGPAYIQARRALHFAPLTVSQLAVAQGNPSQFAGKVFELSARVSGFVTADAIQTVLLSVGSSSLAARMPASLPETRWLTSGLQVRILLRVDKTGNDISLSNLTVIAAAPDTEVAAMERAASVRGVYPSRSLSYSRTPRIAQPSYPSDAPAAPNTLTPRAQAIYGPYWNAVRGMNPRLSTANVDKITTSILYFSDQNDIDPRLIMAMIICESGFDIDSTSRTGAMGLGQLMPETARGLGVTNAYDPVQNIAASVHILRGRLDQYGGAPAHAGTIPFNQIALTMAAYNAGPGAVRKYHGVPPYRETQRYVAKVAALYKRMCSQGT